MKKNLLLADLKGYLRAFAEWNMPGSNLTYEFDFSRHQEISALDEKSLRDFYARFADVSSISVHSDWKPVVAKTARHWMTAEWSAAGVALTEMSVGTDWGRQRFESTLLASIEAIAEPLQVVIANYECRPDKKYAWYAASWDDLWLGNAQGESYLLHFSVTD